jgi:hypothetical protein
MTTLAGFCGSEASLHIRSISSYAAVYSTMYIGLNISLHYQLSVSRGEKIKSLTSMLSRGILSCSAMAVVTGNDVCGTPATVKDLLNTTRDR